MNCKKVVLEDTRAAIDRAAVIFILTINGFPVPIVLCYDTGTIVGGTKMTRLISLDQWLLNKVSGGFSRRDGGVSQGVYRSLNVGFHVGDDASHVVENRLLLARDMGIDVNNIVFGEQIHSNQVEIVTKDTVRSGPFDSIAKADGLVTSDPSIALGVLTADCVPLLFADARAGVIGVAHAGWRGATSGIISEVIANMVLLGGLQERIRVAIGPAIRSCCYEVDTPVIRAARVAYDRMGRHMPSWQKSTIHTGTVMMDLPRICHDELRTLGIVEEHILDTAICTSCMPGSFSHRRDFGQSGRQAGLIRLRG